VIKGALIGQGRTAEVYAWGDGRILKLYRPEMPREWVDYEARAGRLVTDAGLAAPAIAGVVEVDGRAGILYERIDGPTMLEMAARRPWTLFRSAAQLAELHAAMHACPAEGLPRQRESLRRAIARAPRLAETARAQALQALEALPDGDQLCHGDYHPENILMSAGGPVVIDWMTATCGNPVADVARTSLLFRMGRLPPGSSVPKKALVSTSRRLYHGAYLRRYAQLRPLPRPELEAWLPVLAAARLAERIPAEEDDLLRVAEAAFGQGG